MKGPVSKVAGTTREIIQKSQRRHVMPGLVSEIARTFRTPRQNYTTLAVQEDLKVRAEIVHSALHHEELGRIEVLERNMDRVMRAMAVGRAA